MPRFRVELSDGRKFVVEAATQPTNDEVLAQLGSAGAETPRASRNTDTADTVNRAVGLNSSEPETYGAGVGRSLEDTGLRTIKGVSRGVTAPFLHPIDTATGMYDTGKDLLTGGHQTMEGLRRIASGDPEAGGEAIGGLLLGKLIPKGLSLARAAVPESLGSSTAVAAAKAALEKTPAFGPMGRAALDAAKEHIAESAKAAAAPERAIPGFERYGAQTSSGPSADFGAPADVERFRTPPQPPRGANLVKAPTGLSDELAKLLEELRTSSDLPESVGGSAKPIPSNVGPFDSRIANMDPISKIPGMEASLPDKTGTTVVRPTRAPYTHPAAQVGTRLPPELERALINALRYGKQAAALR